MEFKPSTSVDTSSKPSFERLRRNMHIFWQEKLSVVGLIVIILLIVLAIFGEQLVPFPQDAEGTLRIKSRLKPPSSDHFFGTDWVGRDVFSRVIIGTRLALQIAAVVLVIAAGIGLTLGALAGLAGGLVDNLIMRVTDIFLVIPYLVLAIAIAALLGPGMINAFIALSLVWWPGFCRLMRGQVLSIKEDEYVVASRAMGASVWWIIWKHILPNTINEIMVKLSMDVGLVLLAAAALGFIGLGAEPPTPEWGSMISESRKVYPTWWWNAVFPGAAIFISVLAFNLFGDGISKLSGGESRR